MYTVRKSATKLRHKTRRRIHQIGGDDDVNNTFILDIYPSMYGLLASVSMTSGEKPDAICFRIIDAIKSVSPSLPPAVTTYYIKPRDNRLLVCSGDDTTRKYRPVTSFKYLYMNIKDMLHPNFLMMANMYFMIDNTIVYSIMLEHLKEFNIYSDSVSKTLFDANNVYTYLGHGSDVPVSDGRGSFIRNPMPAGCVYITVVECGTMSNKWGYFLRLFASTDPYTCGVLNDPIVRYDELKELFVANNIPAPHIHYAGAQGDMGSYTEALFSGGMTWQGDEPYLKGTPHAGAPKIAISGLHKHAGFKYNKLISEGNTEEIIHAYNGRHIANWQNTIWQQYSSGEIGLPVITRMTGEVKAILYTAPDIKSALTGIDNIKITLSELFATYPGVYYHPVCRAVVGHNFTTGIPYSAASLA